MKVSESDILAARVLLVDDQEDNIALLSQLLANWLAPLRAMNPAGEPVAEVMAYVRRKLELSRDFPRESRLFANEILQGAPRIQTAFTEELKPLVDDKAAIIARWMDGSSRGVATPHSRASTRPRWHCPGAVPRTRCGSRRTRAWPTSRCWAACSTSR